MYIHIYYIYYTHMYKMLLERVFKIVERSDCFGEKKLENNVERNWRTNNHREESFHYTL